MRNLAQLIIAALTGPQWAAIAIAEAKRRIELQALPGNRRHARGNEGDKARKHGIPKRFRQYAKRYGKKGIDDIVQMHAKYRVPALDHARDRREAMQRAMGVAR